MSELEGETVVLQYGRVGKLKKVEGFSENKFKVLGRNVSLNSVILVDRPLYITFSRLSQRDSLEKHFKTFGYAQPGNKVLNKKKSGIIKINKDSRVVPDISNDIQVSNTQYISFGNYPLQCYKYLEENSPY